MADETAAYERMNPGLGDSPVYSPIDIDILNGWRRLSPPAAFQPLVVLDPNDPWFIYTTQPNTDG